MEKEYSYKETQERVQKDIKLQIDSPKRTLTIYSKHKIPTELSKQDMLQGIIGLRQMMQLLQEEPVDFSMEILADGGGISLRLSDDESLKRMHVFLNDLLFDKRMKKIKKLREGMTEPFRKRKERDKRVTHKAKVKRSRKPRDKPKETPDRKPKPP